MKNLPLVILATAAALISYPISATAGPIRDRMVNQQQRIYYGVKNDTISGAEYRNLERRSASVAAQRYRYAQSGDGLTVGEKAVLNYRLNNISRSIYRDKHD
jgi:hypothetical protein